MGFKGGNVLGTIALNTSTAGTTAIGSGTNTGTITIGSTNSAAVSIDCGTAGITVGTTVNAHSTTVGSTNSTSATTVQSGSGALAVTSTNGTLTINSGTGTLGISTDAAATIVNIATGGAVKTTTLGSTNTTSATLIKGGTGASSFQPTTTGTLALGTTSTGAVSLGNTTGTTTIQFGTGSALSTFVDWAAWTPTVTGSGTAGTTTYTAQVGSYSRIGNIVHIYFTVSYSAATGTGDLTIGGLTLTIANQTSNNPIGACYTANLTYPVGYPSVNLYGILNTTTIKIIGSATVLPGAFVQMTNAICTITGSLTYRV